MVVIAYQIKLIPKTPAFQTRVPQLRPKCSISYGVPASVPGKAGNKGPSAWTPALHVRDPGGVSCSWLQHGPARAV